MRKTVLATLLAGGALALWSLAQPAPPPGAPFPMPPTPPAAPGTFSPPPGANPLELRHAERASKEIYRLQYELPYAQGPRAALAQDLSQRAQEAYRAGRYFQAAELAAAALRILEAGRLEAGVPVAGPGRRGRGFYYSAPFRAQERIQRVEAELAYYRVQDPLARRLLEEAKTALAQSGQGDFYALLRAEAARKLADAAQHLIRAERGF